MNGHLSEPGDGLGDKIAALVRERGWCQSEFARRACLSVQTAREILESTSRRRLRNRTIFNCARALGLSVAELRDPSCGDAAPSPGRFLRDDWRYDLATQPRLKEWMDNERSEASRYTPAELEELMSMQGTGGPLTDEGLAEARQLIERKRDLLRKVQAIAGTEYLGLLESMVQWLFRRTQPYGE
jgi:hypothetical protein